MGRLFVSSLHITVDGPRQSAPAITREWAEPETLGHADASDREFQHPINGQGRMSTIRQQWDRNCQKAEFGCGSPGGRNRRERTASDWLR